MKALRNSIVKTRRMLSNPELVASFQLHTLLMSTKRRRSRADRSLGGEHFDGPGGPGGGDQGAHPELHCHLCSEGVDLSLLIVDSLLRLGDGVARGSLLDGVKDGGVTWVINDLG
mmetsp:Transcript_42918/g.93215  ORF Transcript_42918/g.93215 Transcript_42918/m.93215 type:complete len:115 (-) Transcript_42918:541-885(-)